MNNFLKEAQITREEVANRHNVIADILPDPQQSADMLGKIMSVATPDFYAKALEQISKNASLKSTANAQSRLDHLSDMLDQVAKPLIASLNVTIDAKVSAQIYLLTTELKGLMAYERFLKIVVDAPPKHKNNRSFFEDLVVHVMPDEMRLPIVMAASIEHIHARRSNSDMPPSRPRRRKRPRDRKFGD